jgi:hypothetical protein
MGPIPRRARSAGARALTLCASSRSSACASARSARTRRASERRARAQAARSELRRGRSRAQAASSAPSGSRCSRSLSSGGALTRSARSSFSAAVQAEAPSRVLSSARSACVSVPSRGRAPAAPASSCRAARSASSASDFERPRAHSRAGRSTSSTRSPRACRKRGEPGTVAASALERPGAAAGGVPEGEPERLPGAAPAGRDRQLPAGALRARLDEGQRMAGGVRVDAEDEGDVVCEHGDTSSDGGPGAGRDQTCRGKTGRSHAASADGLLIKPAACPAGTACSPGQIPGQDTRSEVGQVSSHGRAGRRQPDRRSGRGRPLSQSGLAAPHCRGDSETTRPQLRRSCDGFVTPATAASSFDAAMQDLTPGLRPMIRSGLWPCSASAAWTSPGAGAAISAPVALGSPPGPQANRGNFSNFLPRSAGVRSW